MMNGRHPYVTPDNFNVAVVKGEIAACIINMPWTYMYDGIEIKISRLEQVYTDPKYFGRRLIRELMKITFEETFKMGSIMDVVYGKP